MAFSIRVATQADQAALIDIIERYDALDLDSIPLRLRQPRLDLTVLALILDTALSAVFVIEQQGTLLGFTAASLVHPPDGSAPHAAVNAFAVDRGYQRLGLGRVLMARVHRWARVGGARWVELRYPDNADAIGFYEDLGYRAHGRKRMILALAPGDF